MAGGSGQDNGRRHRGSTGGGANQPIDYSDSATHQLDLTDFEPGTREPVHSEATVDLGAAKRKASIVPGYDPLDHVGSDLAEPPDANGDYAGPESFAKFAWEASTGESTSPMEIDRLVAGARQEGLGHDHHVELDDTQIATAEMSSPAAALADLRDKSAAAPAPAAAPPARPARPPQAAPRQAPPVADYSVTGESSSVLMADEWEQDALKRSIWPYVIAGALLLALLAAVCLAVVVAFVSG